MDFQTVSIGLSILLSILALVLSFVVYFDNRRKTKIMNQQLGILQEQAESKKEIRDAIRTVSRVQEMISKLGAKEYDWGDFGAIAYVRLLEKLHDSGKKMIVWRTHTGPMVFGEFFAESLNRWNRFESFLSTFEKRVTDSRTKLEIEFLSHPELEATPGSGMDRINVGEYVKDIHSLRIACDELNSIAKVINIYDRSLPDDIHRKYLRILRALQERLLQGYELEIGEDLKTKELPDKLLSFIAYDVWKECIKDIDDHIVPRLYDIERRMLEIV